MAVDDRPDGLDRLFHQGPQVQALLADRDSAVGDPRDVEQVVQQAGHVVGLAINDSEGIARNRTVAPLGLKQLRGVQDRTERIAEFMGKDCQKAVALREGLAGRASASFSRVTSVFTTPMERMRPNSSRMGNFTERYVRGPPGLGRTFFAFTITPCADDLAVVGHELLGQIGIEEVVVALAGDLVVAQPQEVCGRHGS